MKVNAYQIRDGKVNLFLGQSLLTFTSLFLRCSTPAWVVKMQIKRTERTSIIFFSYEIIELVVFSLDTVFDISDIFNTLLLYQILCVKHHIKNKNGYNWSNYEYNKEVYKLDKEIVEHYANGIIPIVG